MSELECPLYFSSVIVLAVGIFEAFYYGVLIVFTFYDFCNLSSDSLCPICYEEMAPNTSFFPSYLVGHTPFSENLLFFAEFVPEITSDHIFHESCLTKCLQRNPELATCPLCRKIICDVRDVAFDVFCKMNVTFFITKNVPSLSSLLHSYSKEFHNVVIEQYFLQVLCTRDTQLLLENFMIFQKRISKFRDYFVHICKIFDFQNANPHLFSLIPLEAKVELLKEIYFQEKFDLFCFLYEKIGSSTEGKDAFLVEFIEAEIAKCSKSEFKLVLLFERLSSHKKSQIKSKIFCHALKCKNVDFLVRFLLFYPTYPESIDSSLRQFITKDIDFLFQRHANNLFFLYSILTKEYPALNSLLLTKAIEYDQLPFLHSFLINPKLLSFSGERKLFLDKLSLLAHPACENLRNIFDERNFQFISKRSVCVVS